jgi:hypothetical protein
MALLSDALTIARTYLNDDLATQFPDPALIPKVQEAHRELQEQLWLVGSPIVRGQVVLAYLSSSGAVFPTVPTDFLCPFALLENTASSTISSLNWIPMTECFSIPEGTVLAATLKLWAWNNEVIQIVGASANRAILLKYRKLIPIPVDPSDPLGMIFAESYLGARAAAIAYGTVQNLEAAGAADTVAQTNLQRLMATHRGQQKPLERP